MRIVRELKGCRPIHEIFRQFAGEADAVFLDSSLKNSLGRYSIIGLHPYLKLVKGETFTANGIEQQEPFEAFVRRYLKENQEKNETNLPIVSGAVGYFSYDYGRKKEGVATRHGDETGIPDCVLVFYDDFILQDHEDGERLFLAANGKLRPAAQAVEELETLCRKPRVFSKNPENVCESSQAPVGSPGAACESPEAFMGSPGVLCESLEAFMGSPGVPCESPEASVGSSGDACERAQSVTGSSENTCGGEEAIFAVESNFEKEAYKQAVREMIRYITEGDIYIANMTRHLKIKSPKKPWEVFEELRQNNPSPFGGYLNYGDFQVVCASPERFLKMRNGHISTRPIKGTRKRGADPKEDLAMRLELENSEKDKSELLMIVDLERNDLNRVCVPGSVRVTELFTVEEYATVFHLVANVEGDLAPGNTVMDLVEAAFPGGSITGAPKLRAMEIIDELEHGRRNLYTGSIGYLTLDGCCDFNIVIRTALHCRDAWYLGVGGGITWESELEFEYEETRQKAAAILNALAPKGDGRHEDLDG